MNAAKHENTIIPKAKSTANNSKRQPLPASLKVVIQEPRQSNERRKSTKETVDVAEVNRVNAYCAAESALRGESLPIDTSAVGTPGCSGLK